MQSTSTPAQSQRKHIDLTQGGRFSDFSINAILKKQPASILISDWMELKFRAVPIPGINEVILVPQLTDEVLNHPSLQKLQQRSAFSRGQNQAVPQDHSQSKNNKERLGSFKMPGSATATFDRNRQVKDKALLNKKIQCITLFDDSITTDFKLPGPNRLAGRTVRGVDINHTQNQKSTKKLLSPQTSTFVPKTHANLYTLMDNTSLEIPDLPNPSAATMTTTTGQSRGKKVNVKDNVCSSEVPATMNFSQEQDRECSPSPIMSLFPSPDRRIEEYNVLDMTGTVDASEKNEGKALNKNKTDDNEHTLMDKNATATNESEVLRKKHRGEKSYAMNITGTADTDSRDIDKGDELTENKTDDNEREMVVKDAVTTAESTESKKTEKGPGPSRQCKQAKKAKMSQKSLSPNQLFPRRITRTSEINERRQLLLSAIPCSPGAEMESRSSPVPSTSAAAMKDTPTASSATKTKDLGLDQPDNPLFKPVTEECLRSVLTKISLDLARPRSQPSLCLKRSPEQKPSPKSEGKGIKRRFPVTKK